MAEPGIFGERLGHERRPHTLVEGDLLDDVAERHHVVGHRQRVGVAQVDLLLAGRALVVAELHRDAHLTPARRWRAGGSSAPSRARPGRSSRRCRRGSAPSRRTGRASAGRTRSRGARSRRSRGRWPWPAGGAARGGESAHDGEPSGMVMSQNIRAEWCWPRAGGPRQHLERRRIGPRDGVGFGDPGEALDRRAVEADALLEGALEFGGRDRDRLQVSEHVGEPQPDETDVPFLQRAQHEFLLAIHDRERRHRLLNLCYGGWYC